MKKRLKTLILAAMCLLGMLVLGACGTKDEPVDGLAADPSVETASADSVVSEDTVSGESAVSEDVVSEDAVSEDLVSEDSAEAEDTVEQTGDMVELSGVTVDAHTLYNGYYEGYTYGTAPLASVVFLLNEMEQVDSEYYVKTEEVSTLTKELHDCVYAPDEAIAKLDEIMFKDMGGAEIETSFEADDESRDFCVMILVAGSGLFDSEDEEVFNQQAADFLAGNFLPNHEDYKPVEGMTAPAAEE